MRKTLRTLTLGMFIGVSVLSVSCQKDDMESITLKSSGELTVTILNGEEPLSNVKVWLIDEETGNEIDVVLTKEDGKIDFQKLNEGTYVIALEIKSPQYTQIYQEVQVISGASVDKVLQLANYVGTFTVELIDRNTDENVKEDVGLGIAMIPQNDVFFRANSNEEKIALATAIEYFGTEGQITFEKLPTAYYQTFIVRGDSIISQVSNFEMDKLADRYWEYEIDVVDEKMMNKASWSVSGVVDEASTEISTFPASMIRFYKDNNGSRRFTMTMKNEVTVSGYYSINNGGEYLYFYSYSSNNPNFNFSIGAGDVQEDETGKLVLNINYFSMNDLIGDTDFADYNLQVSLE